MTQSVKWFDCEHALFSIAGMAAVAFKANRAAHPKTVALGIIERYSQMLDEIQENNGDIADDIGAICNYALRGYLTCSEKFSCGQVACGRCARPEDSGPATISAC
jgi:hypothetical protein